MKKLLAILLSILLLCACIPLGALSVSAETYGVLTYIVFRGEVTITDCSTSASGALTIPSTINGSPVTTIGKNAFSYCDSLTSVTIGDSVTTIGEYAFYKCTSLTSVTIGNSVTTIGNSAFSTCDSLTSVTIPDSVTTIGNWAFSSCNSLTSIQVDENNPNYCDIDGVLFNKSKTTLVQYPVGRPGAYAIPDSVTTIGYYAFGNCDSLTSVTIPDSVTTIGNDAFSWCYDLTSVTIPDSVTTIGYSAFWYCISLTLVAIGDSVTTIGDSAFYYCPSLTDVYYNGTEADRANIAIGSDNTALTNATWHYNACKHKYDNACDVDCNVCGETREVGEHIYDNACDAGCNVCGALRQVAPHTYVGAITTPNNCGNAGVMTYTCTACGDTYTEVLPPVGDHVYDNGFDADCNVCGDVRPVDVPDDAPTFVVEDATTREGDTFTVAIRTLNNSGIVSLKLKVGYDTDMLELVTMAEGDFTGLSFGPMDKVPFIVNWVDAIHPNNTTDGTVVLLTFRVKEGAAIGETAITVTYNQNDVYNSDFDNVAFLVENGTVNVVDFLYGDANGDGEVDNKDLGLLQRYINEWDVTLDTSATDMDGNGKVNNLDLGLLQRYLNGWDITLNPVRPTVALPTTPYDVDGKGRIFVESIALEGDTVSVLFANHHTKWISEETSYVKYICTDSAGNVLTTDDKHYGYLYFGVLEVGGSRLMTFTLPESTAKVEFGDAYIFYWTQWA